jgi:hypothetical protein
MSTQLPSRTRAQQSRSAIERLYISMRHLLIRGGYKPMGVSGEAMISALQDLRPEIYGSINDPERVELEGLLYIFQRLPRGIEEVQFIRLVTKEGFEKSLFEPIIAPKRRRNAYRIDSDEIYIEMTRGRSDIYDILTHLTFMYIEAEKIRRNSENHRKEKKREWKMLEELVEKERQGLEFNKEVAYIYLSTLLGRTYEETVSACKRFEEDGAVNSLFHITYWLGKRAGDEQLDKNDREITFSSALRERVGHHHHGEVWAIDIKQCLSDRGLLERPLHVISANPHSVMNSLYAQAALQEQAAGMTLEELTKELSLPQRAAWRARVFAYAQSNGMIQLEDGSGANITVQIFDTAALDPALLPADIQFQRPATTEEMPVMIVMDYAFGEQAYETMDELLRPFDGKGTPVRLDVRSINIMGKAGILEGGKGDIMIPTSHVFEGTADNYPFQNDLTVEDFMGQGLRVSAGTMITVLGTSLQNKDVLQYLRDSSWRAIGLEMEGAHYQKAIQASSQIRNNIRKDVVLRYAYYASDNPLLTGHTLASGSLGLEGVKPTYLITKVILNRILSAKHQ